MFWLRVKLAYLALRYPQFTKWALDNAAGECLVGRRYVWGQVSDNEHDKVARKVATTLETRVR